MTKRSLEELQQIEAAIRNKFGEAAITNPKSLWNEEAEKDYKKQISQLNDKSLLREKNEEKVEKDGFLISKRLLTIEKVEGCPTCGKCYTDARDSIYLLKFECCLNCYVLYVEDREERWKNGWRPIAK